MHLPSGDAWTAIYSIAGTLVILAAFIRWARPKWRRMTSRWTAAGDALLGREAIHEPITGRELAPALPGIGQRMATVEDAVKTLTETVSRLDAINERLDRHEAQIGTNTENIAAIMTAAAERIVTKAEAAEMWRAIADKDAVVVDEEPGEIGG